LIRITIVVVVVVVVVTFIFVAREQLGKDAPAKKNSWPTIRNGLSIARQRAVNKFHQQ
jgi:hypothetical protein